MHPLRPASERQGRSGPHRAGDALRIDVQALDGRLLRSIRAHHDRRPVRPADLDALVEMQLARARSVIPAG